MWKVESQNLSAPFNPMLEWNSNVAGVPHLRGQQQGGSLQALLQGGPHHHPHPLRQEAYNMTTWHTPNAYFGDMLHK